VAIRESFPGKRIHEPVSGVSTAPCFLDEGVLRAYGFRMRHNGIAKGNDSGESKASRFDAAHAHAHALQRSFLQDHLCAKEHIQSRN